MGLKYSTFDSHIVYLEIGTFESHFKFRDQNLCILNLDRLFLISNASTFKFEINA